MATAYMKLSETSTGADAQAALNQAADAYANADALGPDAGVANNRALLLARLGRFSEAQAEFAKAARIDPAHAGQYLFNSGAVLVNGRQPGEALLSFQKAVAADPSLADAWFLIGTILCGGMTVDEEGNPNAPSGLAEAFQKYMALRPQGKYAAAAKDLLAAAGSQVQTTYRSDPNFILPKDRVAATKAPIQVGGTVQQAALVYQPRPVYPRLAKLARVQGAVCLTAIIGRDGTIPYLKLVSGNPLLVTAAFEAVRQWRYRPTLLNGEPVEVITRIDVNFTLNGGE
jgi:TonB family protein